LTPPREVFSVNGAIATVSSIVKGEPDPSLFVVPTSYAERAPSQVMAEFGECFACGDNSQDAGYYRAQAHKR
jgi:hypothetical protein